MKWALTTSGRNRSIRRRRRGIDRRWRNEVLLGPNPTNSTPGMGVVPKPATRTFAPRAWIADAQRCVCGLSASPASKIRTGRAFLALDDVAQRGEALLDRGGRRRRELRQRDR